jgi:hypothetical protein
MPFFPGLDERDDRATGAANSNIGPIFIGKFRRNDVGPDGILNQSSHNRTSRQDGFLQWAASGRPDASEWRSSVYPALEYGDCGRHGDPRTYYVKWGSVSSGIQSATVGVDT